MLEAELKKLILASGASDVGFACVKDCLPDDVPPTLVNAVSFVYKLSSSVIKTITNEKPSIMYFQHYRAVNARLDQIALDVCRFIEENGYNAFPIAASQSRNGEEEKYNGVISHKAAAIRAGLGFIGKNNMLISSKAGIGVRLCTVLTDMPLTTSNTRIENMCGKCNKCVEACPAKALKGKVYEPGMSREEILDPKACSEHMKTYKDIGRGAVCGICMMVCPYFAFGK